MKKYVPSDASNWRNCIAVVLCMVVASFCQVFLLRTLAFISAMLITFSLIYDNTEMLDPYDNEDDVQESRD